ncbi:MAG TPA: FHA domain-containing protein [Polyangiaceae bacterium]|nr:FHA domain-containing protein [Polyangiaceae bacterium]
MSSDPSKKSPRTFQCRDILWEAFQQMAQELECSVDYLLNESMKQYARQRYAGRTSGNRAADGASASQASTVIDGLRVAPPAASPAAVPVNRGSSFPPAGPVTNPLPPPPPGRARPLSNLPPPPLPRAGAFPAAAGPRPGPLSLPNARSVPPPLPGTRGVPPPPPTSPNRFAPATPPSAPPSYAGQLSVVYAGERLAVNKDRFIIGRGKQSSDLTIKDPNVSRQHAMVEFLNGQYYMVDMGSTNGVEFNGQRVARRPIAEGDTYRICDHEVRFTYR